MSIVATWCCIAIYAAVVIGWLLRHVLISLTRPMGLFVEPAKPADVPHHISVIVPARNERDRIAGCVETLLRQGDVVREIIVVDDRSDDGTADVVRAAANGDPRLRIVRIDALPDGWAGKAHACQCGGELATSDWLLFADADCRFHDGGLDGALHYAAQHDIDLLSLWIAADHRTFWEHTIIPLCGATILYWFPPLRANQPGSRLAFANGQFILIRRDAYHRIGGHAAARDTVIEDIPLAQHAKRSGLRLRTALGADIVSVRMYANLRQILNGWTRIFIGALQRKWKMLVSILSLIGGSLLPSIGAPLSLFWIARHGWPHEPATATFVILLWLHFLAVYSVSYRVWGLCRCDRRHLAIYPLSVLMVIGILIRAIWWMLTGRRIVWRGSVTGRD